MNFVWWMYAADVVGSVSTCLTLASIASVVGYGVWVIWASLEDAEGPPFRLLGWAIAFALVASVIPSTKTMYAVAATQAGKDAIATPTGQKAMKALDAWLDRQIAGEKSE